MIHSPYPGMRPFAHDEAEFFFGREQQTYALVDRLAATRFLAVVGTSGCGKSSLVKAGLIAGLETGLLARAGTRWQVLEMRPQRDPFVELAAALGEANAVDTLRHSSLGLHHWLRDHPPAVAGTKCLLVVDQFEELFRYADHRDSTVADAFAALLLASARPWPDNRTEIYVVLTMRSDFLGECARFPGLAETVNQGLFLTPRLTREQLRTAIEEPALVAGGEVEPALITRLLRDSGETQDQLPLLQHALQVMWQNASQQSREPQLTLHDYQRDLNSPGDALNQRLEAIYKGFSEARQRLTETLFRQLARPDTEQRDVRRNVTVGEVAAVADCSLSEVQAVIDAFREPGRDFLSPPPSAKPSLAADDVLDVCHESLLRQWTRLSGWLQDEARDAETYSRLRDTAHRWQAGEADLLQGLELSTAELWWNEAKPTAAWARRYSAKGLTDEPLNRRPQTNEEAQDRRPREGGDPPTEIDSRGAAHHLHGNDDGGENDDSNPDTDYHLTHKFLTTSSREAERARRRYRRNVGLTMLLLALIAGAMTWQWQQAEQAEAQAEAAEKRRTVALFESSLTHAALLSRNEDYAKADKVLQTTRDLDSDLPAPRQHTRTLLQGYAQLMGNPAQQVYQDADGPLPALFSVAVSPDGTLLATAGERGVIALFEVASGKLLRRWVGHEPDAIVFGLAFHPQAGWLVSGGGDGQIIRWDPHSDDPLSTWQAPARIWALAISPDGQWLASGGTDNDISLWDLASGTVVRTLTGHTKAISNGGLAFSDDSRRLASGSYDNSARIWRVADGELLHELSGLHQGPVRPAFSPDGAWLATGSSDQRLILWDANSGTPRRLLRGHQNLVFGPMFSADSRQLISPSHDRTLRRWDVASGVTLGVWQGHDSGITAQPDRHGDAVFSAGQDGTVRRWSLAPSVWTGAAWRLWELPSEPFSTAISPDGKLLAIGFTDGALRLYRLPDGTVLWEDAEAHDGKITRLDFNADGTWLASAEMTTAGIAKLWRVELAENVGGATQDLPGFAPAPSATPAGTDDTADGANPRTDSPEFGDAADDGSAGLSVLDAPPAAETDLAGLAPAPSATPAATDDTADSANPRTDSPELGNTADEGSAGLSVLHPPPAAGETDLAGLAPAPSATPAATDDTAGGANPRTDSPEFGDAADDGSAGLSVLDPPPAEDKAEHDGNGQDENTAHGASRKAAPLMRPTETVSLTLSQTFTAHTRGVHDITFAPDGQTLATASYDGHIGLFRLDQGEPMALFEAHEGYVEAVAFSPDGHTLLSTGYDDRSLKLWDLTTTPPTLQHTLYQAQDKLLWATLSADGRRAAAVGRGSNVTVLPLTDTASPAASAPLRLPGHEQTVFKAVFDPSGEVLATVSTDATVRLWDVVNGEALFRLQLPTNAGWPTPLWDFDFRCVPTAAPTHCVIAVPLTRGVLALYRLPY